MGQSSVLAPPGALRGRAWQYLDAAGRQTLGDPLWTSLARDAGAPEATSLDPLGLVGLAPVMTLLRRVERERGPDALRAIGRGVAERWAHDYRHLARELRGQPRAMLEVACAEVQPWMLDDPAASRVVDTGPTAALVELPNPLPDAFKEGLLAGFVAETGVEGAQVAAQGGRFAVAWEAAQPKPALPSILAQAVRAPFLTATLVPVLVGAALAWREGFLAPEYAGLTFLGVALLHLGANAANDYFERRDDAANLTPTRFSGGSRVLQRGLLSARGMLRLALGLSAAGAATGLLLAFRLQSAHGAGLAPVLALGLAGALLGWLYSAPPAQLARRGLGQLAVGLGFGPLIVAGAYLVQRTAAGGGALVSPEAWLFSVPVGALIAAVLTINDVPDAPWDARTGKRTLVVRLGAAGAIRGYAALVGLAYGSIALLALATGAWPVLLALLPLPLAVRAWRLLRRLHAEPYRLLPANAATFAVHLATGLLLVVGLVLARALEGS